MIDPAGWSLAGIRAEFGATVIYRVERRSDGIRVEGFEGADRCMIQREINSVSLLDLPGVSTLGLSQNPVCVEACSGGGERSLPARLEFVLTHSNDSPSRTRADD
jgi:hypothetical protein